MAVTVRDANAWVEEESDVISMQYEPGLSEAIFPPKECIPPKAPSTLGILSLEINVTPGHAPEKRLAFSEPFTSH